MVIDCHTKHFQALWIVSRRDSRLWSRKRTTREFRWNFGLLVARLCYKELLAPFSLVVSRIDLPWLLLKRSPSVPGNSFIERTQDTQISAYYLPGTLLKAVSSVSLPTTLTTLESVLHNRKQATKESLARLSQLNILTSPQENFTSSYCRLSTDRCCIFGDTLLVILIRPWHPSQLLELWVPSHRTPPVLLHQAMNWRKKNPITPQPPLPMPTLNIKVTQNYHLDLLYHFRKEEGSPARVMSVDARK